MTMKCIWWEECSVYINNLSFKTRDSQPKAHFRSAVRKRTESMKSLRWVKVAIKRGTEGRASEQLSTGFRFAQVARAEDAVEAVKALQNTKPDGQPLRLQVSKRSNRHGAEDVRRRKQ